MAQTFNSREQELRHEFHNQKLTGIPNYSAWLEQKVIIAEKEKGYADMAAEKNYELWQKAERENERLLWDGD